MNDETRVRPVPNTPKTPHLTIRAPRELQDAAKAKAAAEETTVTAVLLAALHEYVSGPESE